MGGGEGGVGVEDVESGKHGDDVAVVDAEVEVSLQPHNHRPRFSDVQAEEQLASIWALFEKIGRSV